MEKNSMENSHTKTWNRAAIHIQKRPFGNSLLHFMEKPQVWSQCVIALLGIVNSLTITSKSSFMVFSWRDLRKNSYVSISVVISQLLFVSTLSPVPQLYL